MPVTITVDYSNGATRTISGLPADAGDLFATLNAAAERVPPLAYEFEVELTDRGGREVGQIAAVDGVVADAEAGQRWIVWVNGGHGESGCRRPTKGGPSTDSWPGVEPGDVVLLKLVGS